MLCKPIYPSLLLPPPVRSQCFSSYLLSANIEAPPIPGNDGTTSRAKIAPVPQQWKIEYGPLDWLVNAVERQL